MVVAKKRKRPSRASFQLSNSPFVRRFGPYLLYGLITLLVTVLYLDNHRIFATWELGIQDLMIAVGKEPAPTHNVLIVNVDDQAVKKLGPWPWDAERIGYLVGMLNEYEPKAIGLDIELPANLEGDPEGNLFLAEMIRQAGNVVLPLQFTLARPDADDDGAWNGSTPDDAIARSSLIAFDEARRLLDYPYLEGVRVTQPFTAACEAGWGMGHINSWQDVDGIVRRDPLVVRYAGDYYPSMALQLARAALGHHRSQVSLDPGRGVTFPGMKIPSDDAGLFMIDYRGPTGTVPSLSAARVLEGEANEALIAGKIVVVGVSASGYGTGLQTSVDGHMPRTEKIANVTANILDNRFVTTLSLSTLLDLVIIALIGVFCAAVLPRVTLIYRVALLFMMAILFVNLNFVLYSSFKLITKTLFPTLEILAFLAVSPFVKMRQKTKEQEEVDRLADPEAVEDSAVASTAISSSQAVIYGSGPIPTSTPVPAPSPTPSAKVPVRNLDQHKAPGMIKGLESTIISPVSSSSTPVPAPPPVPEKSAPVSVPETGSLPPEVADQPIDMPTVDPDIAPIVSPVDMNDSGPPLSQTAHDLMGNTPQPMGLSESDPGTMALKPPEAKKTEIKQLGRYEILGVLGQGAMGTVYKGQDPAIDRMVALKTIRAGSGADPVQAAELRERLVREAKAAGKLSHPNIVTIYDVGSEGDLNYIAMEYLEGYTLEQVVRKRVQLNYRIAARILKQVCDALDYAHVAGIVHRDIKPANIMVLDNFDIKVTDFGIARFDSPQMAMTQTGIAVGTPQYIAPELLRGEEIDRRCDIFSLGVVAYELLTHRRPFLGENISQLIYAITQKEPERPTKVDPNIPGLFDVIINKALAKDRNARYQTAKEMGNALNAFVADLAGAKSFKI